MPRLRSWLLGLGALALVGISAPIASAHRTGHESRTVAQCEALPGNQVRGERGDCLRCIARPKPHHFHPDYPRGHRCRPNNGKP